jgi:uncharacterized membrane protein YheB (UPF0754 family)
MNISTSSTPKYYPTNSAGKSFCKDNMSLLTNAVAATIMGAGFISPFWSNQLKSIGIFALSGSLTNWIAIYMLFEKVPGLYGSGVIPARFQEFKGGLYTLIVEQFFSLDHIEKVIKNNLQQQKLPAMEKIFAQIDYDKIFLQLTETIEQSDLGGLLQMVGGVKILEPIRPTFKEKLKTILSNMNNDPKFKANLTEQLNSSFSPNKIKKTVEQIIEKKLDSLTPLLVKNIIQDMIKKHLGWLVVWGGVFGGIIGLIANFLNY